VNAIVCPNGLPVEKPDCLAQSDPRGVGLTISGPRPAAPQEPTEPARRPTKTNG
jgi:hypothetical protein